MFRIRYYLSIVCTTSPHPLPPSAPLCPPLPLSASPLLSPLFSPFLPFSPLVRRGLVLVAKLAQNLANAVLFGAKEPYMAEVNPFIFDNLGVLQQFYERLTSIPPIAFEDATMEHVVGADMDAFSPLIMSGSRAEEVDTQLSIIEALVNQHARAIAEALPPNAVSLRLFLETGFQQSYF